MPVYDPNRPTRLALQGVDVVMYLGHLQTVRGKAQHKTKHRGKTYLFCNEENQRLFTNNPELFIPRFEGCCAFTYATSGKFVPASPAFSNIVGDKVYLYSKPRYATICKLVPAFLQLAEMRHEQIAELDVDLDENEEAAATKKPKPIQVAPKGLSRMLLHRLLGRGNLAATVALHGGRPKANLRA